MTDGTAFETWWTRPVEWTDAANARGSGWSRTGRADAADWPELGKHGQLYVKRQQNFFCRPVWNFGRRTPTLRREKRALEWCRGQGVAVPRVLGYAERDTRAVLLIEALPSASNFVDAMASATGAERRDLLGSAVTLMLKLHESRVRHGALYPKHILVRSREAWVIDLEKARRVMTPARAARRDVEQFLRHATFLTEEERGSVHDVYAARGWL